MEPVDLNKVSLNTLPANISGKNNIELFLLRLDKIHPEISGNKWFKIKFYLDDARAKKMQTIVTFGGAWSNHILATAAVAALNNLQSTGIIRGERPFKLSKTLEKASDLGMKLFFLSREEYKQKIIPPELANAENIYTINEGGYGEKGMKGASSIAEYYQQNNFTHICCATGTGTTMAGLVAASSPEQEILGISVLKNNLSIEGEINALLADSDLKKKRSVIHEYHFGGYGKSNPDLIRFMNEFYSQTGIPTDFVYTGKMMYGVYDLAARNYFPSGSRILIIHSGGLQGNNSLPDGTLIF